MKRPKKPRLYRPKAAKQRFLPGHSGEIKPGKWSFDTKIVRKVERLRAY